VFFKLTRKQARPAGHVAVRTCIYERAVAHTLAAQTAATEQAAFPAQSVLSGVATQTRISGNRGC
jgi:hypothetical protein